MTGGQNKKIWLRRGRMQKHLQCKRGGQGNQNNYLQRLYDGNYNSVLSDATDKNHSSKFGDLDVPWSQRFFLIFLLVREPRSEFFFLAASRLVFAASGLSHGSLVRRKIKKNLCDQGNLDGT